MSLDARQGRVVEPGAFGGSPEASIRPGLRHVKKSARPGDVDGVHHAGHRVGRPRFSVAELAEVSGGQRRAERWFLPGLSTVCRSVCRMAVAAATPW